MLEKGRLTELTRVSFECLFFSFFFLFLALHSAIDKIHFNIAERIAMTKSSLFPGCIKVFTANPTTLAMLPC